MHTPSAVAARPLPKRTRSTAGFEEIDAWLGQITSSSTSNTGTTTSASSSPAPVAPVTNVPLHGGASRKRHHSLPASALAGSFQALAAASSIVVKLEPTATTTTATAPAKSAATAFTRRPELALFAGDLFHHHQNAPSPFAHSNQYSPSLHHEPHQFDATYSFLQQQQRPQQSAPPAHHSIINTSNNALLLPEMSPREDFLVRAFVSDAMKLEGGGYDSSTSSERAFTYPADAPLSHPPPLVVHTTALDERSGDNGDEATTAAKAPTASHHKWTRDEDDRLRDAVSRFGGKSWKLIAETLGNGRTDVQCLHRWNKVLKPGLVKGPWTPEEDRVLLSLIARYGVGQIRWCDVALHLPGRIGKQCRERWCNHLDSTIRKGQWMPQEDETVFQLQQTIGNKWSEIAKHLPGRTENAVKNRFNSAARRKWIMSQAHAHAHSTNSSGLVSSPMANTRTSTTSGGGGKTPRSQQQQQRLRHSPSTVARGGGRRSSVPRDSSGGFLSADMLAGPPRPPPPPPSVTTAFRGGGAAYSSSLSRVIPSSFAASSPPMSGFVFGDSDANAYFPPSGNTSSVGTSDQRPAFSVDAGNAFSFRPQFLSTDDATTSSPTLALRRTLPSPPSPHEKKANEVVKHHAFGAKPSDSRNGRESSGDDGDNSSEDNQQVHHSPAAHRGSISTPRRLSMAVAAPYSEDDDEAGLRAIDLPDSDVDGHDEVLDGSLVDMDDQNMSTFLDSVALELDDMI